MLPRSRSVLALFAFVLAPSTALATSFTSGSTYLPSTRDGSTAGFVQSALRVSGSGNFLYVRALPNPNSVASLEFLVSSNRRTTLDLDLNSTVAWAGKLRPAPPRFSGGGPIGAIPEPMAVLLFGVGLATFAASRRTPRN